MRLFLSIPETKVNESYLIKIIVSLRKEIPYERAVYL